MGKSNFQYFLSNDLFLTITFEPKVLDDQIKGSKDSDYSLIKKKRQLQPINDSLVWQPGPDAEGQKCLNLHPL